MKTPWTNLLKHGVAFTTLIVGAICGLVVLSLIGIAVLITKILVFIK